MASQTQDFAANDNPKTSNPSATGSTGSTGSNDPVTGTYGNTHSSTGRTNPIHPSDPQSTAHPAYGNSTFSSPYETGGGNTGQGNGEGAGFTSASTGQGAGVGQPIHSGGQGGLGQEYHDNVHAAYGHATGREPPEGYEGSVGQPKGRYDTGGGNAAQAGGEGATNMSGTQPSAQAGTTSTGAGAGAGISAREAIPDPGYRAQPYASGNTAAAASGTSEVVDNRSTGAKVKEMTQGVKGLFAAAHGAGEAARGTFNAGVDQRFNAVLEPYPIPFPSLRPLGDFAEDGEGEFPDSVYEPIHSRKKVVVRRDDWDGFKGRI